MAEPFVSYALDKLDGFISKELRVLEGVREQVDQARGELRRMHCFLRDADARQDQSELLRNWVDEIRELAYDIEDVVEDFVLNVQNRGNQCAGKYAPMRFVHYMRRVKMKRRLGWELKSIQSRITRLTLNLEGYGILHELRSHEDPIFKWKPLRMYPHTRTPNMVGLDLSTNHLVDHLVSYKVKRVMFIYGMGGLGKTTLAKEIYRHSKTRQHFSRFAWAYISQQCKPRDIWKTIFQQLTVRQEEKGNFNYDVRNVSDEVLLSDLYEILEKRKCLVVLDDIWHANTWDTLQAAFPLHASGSKLLLTSRNKHLAPHVDLNNYSYEPKSLDPHESWELLRRTALFGRDESEYKIDEEMKQLGQKMVEYCKGLPLAITVLGGVLARKTTSMEWDHVYESCIKKRRGTQSWDGGDKVRDVLALSYDDLPFRLKHCFLYLGHFPEDCEIHCGKLLKMWIAEGFAADDMVAKEYLNELVNRCLVLVVKEGVSEVPWMTQCIKRCRIHDLIRDMCLSKAREVKFLEIDQAWLSNEEEDFLPSAKEANVATSTGKIRRIATMLDGHSSVFMPSKYGNTYLRALWYFQDKQYHDYNDLKALVPVFRKFRLLRVLDFEGIGGEMRHEMMPLPKEIGHLNHLRFLSIKNSVINEIPSSIGNLVCLLTLDMRVNTLITIPDGIRQMKSLQHLYLPMFNCTVSGKFQLANLKYLRTVVHFSRQSFDFESSVMERLVKLSLTEDEDVEAFENFLSQCDRNLYSLRSLSLACIIRDGSDKKHNLELITSSCPNLQKLSVRCPVMSFPRHNQLHPYLTSLNLWQTEIVEDPMPSLEKLPILEKLILRKNSFLGTHIRCSKNGFRRLIKLKIISLSHLSSWNIEKGAMTNLGRLTIVSCGRLRSLPDGVEFLRSLEELRVSILPFGFKRKYEKDGEEFYKIKHISRVEIHDEESIFNRSYQEEEEQREREKYQQQEEDKEIIEDAQVKNNKDTKKGLRNQSARKIKIEDYNEEKREDIMQNMDATQVASCSSSMQAPDTYMGTYSSLQGIVPKAFDAIPFPNASASASPDDYEWFRGVALMRKDFIPLLDKIYDEFGDITCTNECLVSVELRAAVLNAIVQVLCLLKSEVHQTDGEAMSLLRGHWNTLMKLGVKVDWLAPFVEKALLIADYKENTHTLYVLQTQHDALSMDLVNVEEETEKVRGKIKQIELLLE